MSVLANFFRRRDEPTDGSAETCIAVE